NLTQLGQVIGTPDYLAPEQALDARGVDIRADIYSLGCSLYFLIAGRPPYTAASLTEMLLKHQMEDPTPLSRLRPAASAELDAAVGGMTAKKRDDRYATPQEVAEALAAFTGKGPAAPVAIPAKPRVEEANSLFADLTEGGDNMVRTPSRRERERETDRTRA